MLRAMRAKLLATVILVRWAWGVPVAHTMPIDADGPSGLSDNADFDDLIVSLTSPTAAVTPMVVMVARACSVAIDVVALPAPGPVSCVIGSSVESRAPPLADLPPNAPADAFKGSARRWVDGDEGAGEQTHDTR